MGRTCIAYLRRMGTQLIRFVDVTKYPKIHFLFYQFNKAEWIVMAIRFVYIAMQQADDRVIRIVAGKLPARHRTFLDDQAGERPARELDRFSRLSI
jgi:hypothetical protein